MRRGQIVQQPTRDDGLVQLPGSGERLVADLGNWRGRRPSSYEWKLLHRCVCPACRDHGVPGLRADKLHGFRCRATHNLWVLLEENLWLRHHLDAGTYAQEYEARVDNSTYQPIIDELLDGIMPPAHQPSFRPES